jgi:hypothetical protein
MVLGLMSSQQDLMELELEVELELEEDLKEEQEVEVEEQEEEQLAEVEYLEEDRNVILYKAERLKAK